jgi:hypothetical protein
VTYALDAVADSEVRIVRFFDFNHELRRAIWQKATPRVALFSDVSGTRKRPVS